MTEQLTLKHERVDDIPLLLAQLDRMEVAKLLDEVESPHNPAARWLMSVAGILMGAVSFGLLLLILFVVFAALQSF